MTKSVIKSVKKGAQKYSKKAGRNVGLAAQAPVFASAVPAAIPTLPPLTGIIAGTAGLVPATAPRLGTMVAGRTGVKVPKTVPLVDQNKGTVHFPGAPPQLK